MEEGSLDEGVGDVALLVFEEHLEEGLEELGSLDGGHEDGGGEGDGVAEDLEDLEEMGVQFGGAGEH